MNPFTVGDIIVMKRSAAKSQKSDYYDYERWALTRLRVTSIDGPRLTAQAIDDRPDLDWLGERGPEYREAAQRAHMGMRYEDMEPYT